MKIKHILIIFSLGFILSIIGSWLKITHISSYQNINWLVGSLLEILAVILFIIKIFTSKKFKDFLNS